VLINALDKYAVLDRCFFDPVLVLVKLDIKLLKDTHLTLTCRLVKILIKIQPLSRVRQVIGIRIILVYSFWPVILDNAGAEG